MHKSKMTTRYFISKFEAIPDDQWCEGSWLRIDGRRCALGHCGETPRKTTPEAEKLKSLFYTKFKTGVWQVNDRSEYGNTPKERILNALKVILRKTRKYNPHKTAARKAKKAA